MILNPKYLKSERATVAAAVASVTITPNSDERVLLDSVHWNFSTVADVSVQVNSRNVITHWASATSDSRRRILLGSPAGEGITVRTAASETGDMVVVYAVVPV